MQSLLAASEYLFDTEDAYTQEIMIDSQEVQVIVKPSKDRILIYWHDSYYFYSISARNIKYNELLKMAESVIIQ